MSIFWCHVQCSDPCWEILDKEPLFLYNSHIQCLDPINYCWGAMFFLYYSHIQCSDPFWEILDEEPYFFCISCVYLFSSLQCPKAVQYLIGGYGSKRWDRKHCIAPIGPLLTLHGSWLVKCWRALKRLTISCERVCELLSSSQLLPLLF